MPKNQMPLEDRILTSDGTTLKNIRAGIVLTRKIVAELIGDLETAKSDPDLVLNPGSRLGDYARPKSSGLGLTLGTSWNSALSDRLAAMLGKREIPGIIAEMEGTLKELNGLLKYLHNRANERK
jgi:hypothetical protein